MPAPSAQVFEGFHNHSVRLEWDALLAAAFVENGGSHPYPGAITTNRGGGWERALGMRTRFLTCDPPRLAPATLVSPTGVLAHWAASMRHGDRSDGTSDLIYAFTIELRPRWLHWILGSVATRVFERETRKRFVAMANFLRERDAMG